MVIPIILASGSSTRAQMLRHANVRFDIMAPAVDEDTIKRSMMAKGAPPRDIADALADSKARKVSAKSPGAWVIGCDQVLAFNGRLMSKPTSPHQARDQLGQMRDQTHMLYSAAVIYRDGQPKWRHVGRVRMQMRASSDRFLDDYVARNWDTIRHAAGAYLLESEGVRLFQSIDGDYFNVLGMPLLEILNFLTLEGVIAR